MKYPYLLYKMLNGVVKKYCVIIITLVVVSIILGLTFTSENTPRFVELHKVNGLRPYSKDNVDGIGEHLVDSEVLQWNGTKSQEKEQNWNIRCGSQFAQVFQKKPPVFLSGFKNPCWYDDDDDRREAWMKRVRKSSTSKRNTVCSYYSQKKRKKKISLLRCLPYFMLIGQPKSASTDLFHRIVEHPEVLPGIGKEPHWFSRHRHCPHFRQLKCKTSVPHTFTEYVDYFYPAAQKIHNSSDEQRMKLITGEGSQSTLWDLNWWWLFPENKHDEEPKLLNAHFVRHILPDVKLVVILRDPVDRLYSDYLYFKAVQNKSVEDFHSRAQRAVATFNDCMMRHSLRYCAYRGNFAHLRLTVGLYAVFLEDWITVFPRKQFFITSLDDYSKNQTMVASKIFKFLDLSDVDGNEPRRTRLNKRKPPGRQVGGMLTETRLLLEQFYKPFNHALSTLLDDPIFLWGT